MFENLSQLTSLLRNAHDIGGKIKENAQRLRQLRVVGSAGGDLVQVEMNGAGESLSVSIDPDLLRRGEKDVIEDLLRAAINDALAQSRAAQAGSLQSLSGMTFPGMEDVVSQLFGGSPDASSPDASSPSPDRPESK